MRLERVVHRVLRRVEAVDVDEVDEHASKKMATVREHNLSTLLDRQVLVLLNRVGEDVHHPNSIEESNDNLETCRMESHAHGIILELLVNLQFEAERRAVTPYLDSLIGRASCYQVFLDTDVHSGDGSRMERMDEVLVERFDVFIIEQADCHLENLVVLRCEDQSVLARRQVDGLNVRADDLGDDLLLFLAHLVVERVRQGSDLLVWVVWLTSRDVDHELALVADDYEAFRVCHDLLNVETVAWVVIQRPFHFTVVFAENHLPLVRADQNPAIGHPAMRRIVLGDVTVLLLVHLP